MFDIFGQLSAGRSSRIPPHILLFGVVEFLYRSMKFLYHPCEGDQSSEASKSKQSTSLPFVGWVM
jgi:hypothetical protein